MDNHILRIKPYSEAEDYFVNTFVPICKDKVYCSLGGIFGKPYNEYVITHDDFIRCREFILKTKKGS